MRTGLFAAALALAGVSAASAQTTVTAPPQAAATPTPPQGTVIAPPQITVTVPPQPAPGDSAAAPGPQGAVIAPPGITVTTLPVAQPAIPAEVTVSAEPSAPVAVPVAERVAEPPLASTIVLSSPAFVDGGTIPFKYTKAGGNISPPLEIKGLPPKAVSYAILMDDPDAEARVSLHWLANLPASITSIPEGRLPKEAVVGVNSWEHTRYDGPDRTTGIHRYFIRVYALDVVPTLPKGFTREDFITLISGHLLGTAQIMGSSNGAK